MAGRSEVLLYKLKGREVVPTDDVADWGRWFAQASRDGSRFVDKTDVGDCRVSTVFVGLDRGFGSTPEPLVFETMVFEDESYAGAQARPGQHAELDDEPLYSSWQEAKAGHQRVVEKVKAWTARHAN